MSARSLFGAPAGPAEKKPTAPAESEAAPDPGPAAAIETTPDPPSSAAAEATPEPPPPARRPPDPAAPSPVEAEGDAEPASDQATTAAAKPEPSSPGYQVLALRYRPQTFSELVGQDAVVRTLQNAIRKDRIWNAFLFSGPRGVGKTTIARILAKALNCRNTPGPTPDPCGGCTSCREIAGGYAPDVPEIDGASHTRVDDVRQLIETASYRPARDRFRIFLVDEVHMLSKSAFNALLKTLEEPPAHVKFIFATTEIHRLPDTILSRCQEFDLHTLSRADLTALLTNVVRKEEVAVRPEALAQIVRFGRGSVRDSLSALDQVISAVDGEVTEADVSEMLGVPGVAVARRAAAAILAGERGEVFAVVEELVAGGRDLRQFLALFMQYLRDLVVSRAAPSRPDLLEWPDEQDRKGALHGKFSEEDLLRSLDVLARADEQLRWAAEPRFHLELALLKLVELPRLARFDEILERLEATDTTDAPASKPAPPQPAAPAPPPPKRRADRQAAPSREIPTVVRDYQEQFGGAIVADEPLPPENPSVPSFGAAGGGR